MIRVTLFRDFIEDKRTSMEVYGDNLYGHLVETVNNEFLVRQYRPQLSGWVKRLPETANLRMRTARYVDYPLQARKPQGTVNHILDHGYAHLLKVLDPQRTVVTVHDVTPILAGQGKIPGVTGQRRARLSEYSASFYRQAAHVIAASQNTKNDLVTCCACDPDNITVVYHGLSPLFRPCSESDRQRYRKFFGLPDDGSPLLLITGVQFYKNQRTSMRVFEQLQQCCDVPVRLVRLGAMTSEWRSCLEKSRYRNLVINIEHLGAKEMVRLYNAVDCLLFPSWYEGFGWPPLEAMACGTPVVASDRGALPETVGNETVTCAPDDVAGFVQRIRMLLTDTHYREQLIKKGLAQAQRFSWPGNAVRVVELYKQVYEKYGE